MLKALIVGCGKVAGGYDLHSSTRQIWSHAKAYHLTPGVKVVGVVDSSLAKARQFAIQWAIPHFSNNLTSALKDLKPDLVSICTPTPTHVSIITQLCGTGVRGILCEKPLSNNLSEAQAAVRVCKRSGVMLAVNYQRNWDDSLNTLGVSLRKKEFGTISLIRVIYGKGLFHNGSHFVSLLLNWFGDFQVEKILAVTSDNQKDIYVDFTASSSSVSRIIFQNVPERDYVLHEVQCFCANGCLEIKLGGLEIRWTGKDHDPLQPQDATLSTKTIRRPATLSRAMLEVTRNVVAALQGKEELKCQPENALKTLHICERIRSLSRRHSSYV